MFRASKEQLIAGRGEVESAERQWLQQVAACDRDHVWKADGAASMTAWLRRTCRLRSSTAAIAVRTARFLDRSPVVMQAWEGGAITADHVQLMARESASAADEFAAVEAEMADIASRMAPDDFVGVLRRWRDLIDPDGKDPADRYSRRCVRWAKGLDGLVHGDFVLDELTGAEFVRLLERLTTREQEADESVPEPARRTSAQQRADALGEMVRAARGHLDRKKPPSQQGPSVSLVVDWDRLFGTGPGRCDLDGVPVSRALAREACCEGTVRRLLTAPSVPLDLGETVRFASPEQRVALEARDGGCVFAGCDRPARWCIAHHVVPWDEGGPTDLSNLALLCRHHHRLVHRGWRIERRPDDVWATTSPLGVPIGTHGGRPLAA